MLQNIILKAWPDQCEERRREQEALLYEQETTIPLFVVDIVLFPNMRLPLHIFEPRYRLMLRRCLEGSRRFGVVPIMGTEIAKVGTTAVIDHHVRLPDGRSLVSTRGGRRFLVLDTWEQDGYKLGRVQYIDEKEPPVDPSLESIPEEELTPEQRSQLDTQRDMERLFRLAKETVNLRIGPALPDIQEKFGTMPEDDAVSFSFWLASLLPIPVQSKQKLLEISSSCTRLQEEIAILNRNRMPSSTTSASSISPPEGTPVPASPTPTTGTPSSPSPS